MSATVKLRVTITGTYEVLRSSLPENYQLPEDAPVADIAAVDLDAVTDDEFYAVEIMDEGTVKVTIAEESA